MRTLVGNDGQAFLTPSYAKHGKPERWSEVEIGTTPVDEPCAQVGEDDYERRARRECARFIERIREVCGWEPGGAVLRTKSNHHDFGRYYEVVCAYVEGNAAAEAYAWRVQETAPTTWGTP